MSESRPTRQEIAGLRDRLLELQHRLCQSDLTMQEWEFVMAAYRIAELQWRIALGFHAVLPDVAPAGENDAVH